MTLTKNPTTGGAAGLDKTSLHNRDTAPQLAPLQPELLRNPRAEAKPTISPPARSGAANCDARLPAREAPMTRDFPPIIAQLIPRLGSSFDGEIIATAKAIERTLRSNSLDWHDLTEALTAQSQLPWQPSRAESCESAEMRAWLEAISRESSPNKWTAGFVGDLLRRSSLDGLTGKQTACVNRIIRQAYDRGIRVDRSAA
jgi:hypothetical protein